MATSPILRSRHAHDVVQHALPPLGIAWQWRWTLEGLRDNWLSQVDCITSTINLESWSSRQVKELVPAADP